MLLRTTCLLRTVLQLYEDSCVAYIKNFRRYILAAARLLLASAMDTPSIQQLGSPAIRIRARCMPQRVSIQNCSRLAIRFVTLAVVVLISKNNGVHPPGYIHGALVPTEPPNQSTKGE